VLRPRLAVLLAPGLLAAAEAAGGGGTFDPDLLRDIPSSGSPWSLLETVEATAILDRIENGGLYVGEAGLLGVHGSSWTQVTYRLGALDITDPGRTGTPLFQPDLFALQKVTLDSFLLPVEESGPGATLSLVPRRPGPSWHGTLSADAVPIAWQASPPTTPPPIARYDSFRRAQLVLEGPLAKDRLGLLISGTLVRAGRLEGSDPTPLEDRLSSLLAHLVWTPSPRDEVRFLGAGQGVEHPYAGRARFGGGDVPQNDRLLMLQSTWERTAGTRWSLTGGYVRGSFEPQTAGQTPTGVVERLQVGPIEQLFDGNSTRERAQLEARLEPPPRHFAGGDHALRFGVQGTRSSASTRPESPRGLVAETVDGLPARVWDYGWAGPESRWRATDFAAYVADSMSFGRLGLEAGLRFESTRAAADGSAGRIDGQGLLPRVSARWRIREGGGLSLFTGYGRYRHRLSLDLLAYGDPAAPQGLVYRWQDTNGNHALDPGEVGPLIARVGPGGSFSSIDPGLKVPHTDEWVVGLEARLGPSWTTRVLGIHRRDHDLLASVNVGAPASAYEVFSVPDAGGDILGPPSQLLPIYNRLPTSFGQDRYQLTNFPGANALHEGVEIALEGKAGERLRFRLGATAYRSVGPGDNRGFRASENDPGLVGELGETPNALTYSTGRLFFDRAYTLKIAGVYHAPGDVRLGLVARYQDGQPFARVVVSPALNQGPEAVQAIPNGRSRFTYTLTLDARVEKGFALGRWRPALVLEAFNLLDTANEVEEDVATGPSFRQPTAIEPPRAFRLGLRLDF
jgi:hypothetical protein